MNLKSILANCLPGGLLLMVFGSILSGQTTLPNQNLNWQDKIAAERVYDFGDVPLGKSAEHSFEMVNTTSETLKIRSVSASCGCTTPKASKMEIKPGEKASVIVKLNTERFRGKKKSTIHVRFDGPESREIQFSISVNIRNLLIEPEMIEFVPAPLNREAKRTVMVSRGGSPYWKITKLETSNAAIKSQIIKKTVKGNKVSYQIECSVLATRTDLPKTHELFVSTNDSKEPKLEIPIRIDVMPPIKAATKRVDFGTLEKASATRKLIIQTLDESRITKLSVDHQQFLVKELKPGLKKVHIHEIQCMLEKPGPVESTLTVQANDGDLETKVQLTATLEPRS